jgi:hypothetical protein
MEAMDPGGPRGPEGPGQSLLPRVLSVAFRTVRYETPRPYWVGRERRQTSQALEILVQTESPLPARALSPVIYVGEVAVKDYKVAGRNLYKYVAFDPTTLAAGAPLTFGWPDLPASRRVALPFRYSPRVS